MSRYLLLFLLNLPFALAGILSAITQYKLKKSSSKKLIFQLIMWSIVIIGLALTEPIYTWLSSNNLTQTEPLSLFDVVQLTAIIVVFYLVMRARNHIETLEKKTRDLHQELSIALSSKYKR